MDENFGMLKKGLVVLAIPFVLQLAFLGVLLKMQFDNAKAQALAIHTGDVIAEVESLTRRLVAVRGNMLGLAVTGDAAANPFDSVASEIDPQIAKLRHLVSDNPVQTARLAEIGGRVRVYLDYVAGTRGMLRSPVGGEALARIKSGEAKRKLDALQADLGGFLAEERRLDRERRAALEWGTTWQTRAIVLGSAATMALAAFLVMAFSRGFARRVSALAENARRLAEGRALAEPIKGKDEIGQLAVAFDGMARSLAERDRENEMFIYSVSHDLRSPLVNLQGFSRELAYTADDIKGAVAALEKAPAVEARLSRLLDKEMPDSIHFIQNAVTRLSAIIDSLLRLSRAGRVEYRAEPLDMNALVARVVESQRASTAERGAEIMVDDLPPALGDATAVEQILANLLTNAVKYLDPARPGRIEVGGERSGGDGDGTVTYHVRDNGLGIPEAHQAKLFVAFQRLHPGVATGEGVGLALVRRMVERHGGRIWAESRPGVGSTFFVTLPAAPDASERKNPLAALIGATE